MATLNIKGLPDRLYRRLKRRARERHRSLAQEVTHILNRRRRAAGAALDPRPARTRQGSVARHRRAGARGRRTAIVGLMSRVQPGPVALDTTCFIYFIEEHTPYADLLQPLFDAMAAGRRVATTWALTLLEVLVVPYRAGDVALAERCEALLTRGCGTLVTNDRRYPAVPGLQVLQLDAPG